MIRYCWPSDDEQLAGQSKIAFHAEDGDWWVGIQKCAATLALAATLAIAATSTAQAQQVFSYQQDDPAGNLKAVPEELSWTPPVSSNLWTAPPRVFTDDEVVVQQPVTFQPDEDFWRNPVPPIPATLLSPKQWAFEQMESGNLFGQPDEDFWANPVSPVGSYPVPLVFSYDDVIVAQPSAFQPDEDFWNNEVPPVVATLAWPQPWSFEQSETGNLFGQYDEDFWNNPVAPVKASFGPLYLPDPEEIPAASLLGVPQESDWSAPPPQLWTPVPKAFLDDDVVFPAAFPPIQDEDFWLNPAAPIAAKNFVALPYLPDADDIPALFGVPQDDFWVPGPPVAAIPVPRVFTDDATTFPAAVTFVGEDYQISLLFWPQPPLPFVVSADEVIVPQPIPLHVEEDLWFRVGVTVIPPVPVYFFSDDVFLSGTPTGPFVAWATKLKTYPQLTGLSRTVSQLETSKTSTYPQVIASFQSYSQLIAARVSVCPAMAVNIVRIVCQN